MVDLTQFRKTLVAISSHDNDLRNAAEVSHIIYFSYCYSNVLVFNYSRRGSILKGEGLVKQSRYSFGKYVYSLVNGNKLSFPDW